ncbi:MAG: multifunctional oxoglutarate decarboxylase/oxoglutarate dehydrogenase thiamine pyrophosphate-binding subunit/dihydrolipoyllysine-residue succinyltransferase subunit, partial [Acidimicrobiia bacterium]|nr:multifunctional oxoglutarate decarboxylase/oxoglutarate dehydrogenase thiamine pyrophosphate-binding subunit/dihydrolipoyllysine-residue succinyltransferase subunit [Acidimicrobiia bacterium]
MSSTDDNDFGANAWLVDQMHRRFLDDPASVSAEWQAYFAGGEAPVASTTPAPVGDTPAQPAAPPQPQPASAPNPQAAAPAAGNGSDSAEIRGPGKIIVERMEASRDLPTATSIRTFPSKLLEVNRRIINNQLSRFEGRGKVSFTHIIGWAVVKAVGARPAMNASYREVGGSPHLVTPSNVNLGLAIDMQRKDGTRTLLVPNIKAADTMTFRGFWSAYEDVVQRARSGKITPDDFAGTTITLTNPGTVGTVQSVPRLMPDQGTIVGVGAIGYPPEYQAADPRVLAQTGVGRVITMTSTYDHRVIQGAESGLFLQRIHQLLLGEEGFYDEIFESMGIPYVPARWAVDTNPPPGSRPWAEKQARVFQLINMYRVRGHLIADLDPLRQEAPAIHAELDPITYGLTIWDLDREFATGGLAGKSQMTLGKILGTVRDAYCRTIGIEYMHIQEPDQKRWIQEHAEGRSFEPDTAVKTRILEKLTQAQAFERFLHTKFLGAKRFSLEGAESFIPMSDELLNLAADAAMQEVAIGMAHRGRLNVLANVVGKPLAQIFREFTGEDEYVDPSFSGDVKYHLGASGTHVAPSGNAIDVQVAANPSHLEAVNPVLEGIVRAKQDRHDQSADDMVLPLLIHGDAAFSGQGVVAETLNLSQLPGYYTGGTIHIVINNQVGFTTAAKEARSSFYATDIAKAVQAPIFHVNSDDPEAVVRVAQMAFAFRQAFHKDVVIDLICYRRLGHNEGDEPTYTQPQMYRIIQGLGSVRDQYAGRLIAREDMTAEEVEAIGTAFRFALDEALAESKKEQAVAAPAERPSVWDSPNTAVGTDRLNDIETRLRAFPEGFTIHPKLQKMLDDRHQQFADGVVDWGLAEALAFGSLVLDGHPVRLAGEDSQRGTFSHRHAVLVDHVTEEEWTPLRNLDPEQASIRVIDSLLSEFAAMGFEYGYSVEAPDTLVLWEGQFGDFVNGAQVVIDQFLTSGEDKWGQLSSLTLLLPHGFEGQGPEHSSARLERFLTNAAEHNIRVAVPASTAQYFHMLRNQALHPARKPLIVLTPKSLLRTRDSFSPVSELSDGSYR